MKKILIVCLLLLAFSPTCFAARWGIGVANLLGTYEDDWNDQPGWLINPATTLFYNFNDQHSIEGTYGIYSSRVDDGDKEDMSVIGLRYLYNWIAGKKFNARVGVQAMTTIDDDSSDDKETLTEISLIFGAECFVADNLSVIADMLASFTDYKDDYVQRKASWINFLPMVSLRFYMP